MRANLNSLGDGVIVLGLGIFFTSIAYVFSQSIPSSSPNYGVYIAGFFALGLGIAIAGILKMANAFYSARDEKASTLKTAVVAFIIGLLPLYYYSIFLFRYPFF